MSNVIENDVLKIEDAFGITLERTLRIPDDGGEYPLPPGMGHFPLYKVEDYLETVPDLWKNMGGYFIPMYQREAMWMRFMASSIYPIAVKVGIGKVNAISGEKWDDDLIVSPQNYVVCPTQPWLDGINAGSGFIKQFVAMPLGQGYTVEAQITGEEIYGGIQLVVYFPKLDKFSKPEGGFLDRPSYGGSEGVWGSVGMQGSCGPQGAQGGPMYSYTCASMDLAVSFSASKGITRSLSKSKSAFIGAVEMGISAGGRMRQKIYPDPHGLDTWDRTTTKTIWIHLANSELFEQITGLKAPETPVSAQSYTSHGYPWFDLYDEHMGDVVSSDKLAGVKSVSEMDKEKEVDYDMGPSVDIGEDQVVKYDIKEGKGLSKS